MTEDGTGGGPPPPTAPSSGNCCSHKNRRIRFSFDSFFIILGNCLDLPCMGFDSLGTPCPPQLRRVVASPNRLDGFHKYFKLFVQVQVRAYHIYIPYIGYIEIHTYLYRSKRVRIVYTYIHTSIGSAGPAVTQNIAHVFSVEELECIWRAWCFRVPPHPSDT